jgi:hypothetical protein
MVCKRETLQIAYVPVFGQPLPDFAGCAGIATHRTQPRNGHVESTLIVDDSSATLAWLLPQILQGDSRLLSVQTQPMTFGDVLLALVETSPKK